MSNGNRLRKAAFTMIKVSTIMSMILAKLFARKRVVSTSIPRLPATMDTSLTAGEVKTNKGSDVAHVIITERAGCTQVNLVEIEISRRLDRSTSLFVPIAKRMGSGETYSILHSWVSLVAGLAGL